MISVSWFWLVDSISIGLVYCTAPSIQPSLANRRYAGPIASSPRLQLLSTYGQGGLTSYRAHLLHAYNQIGKNERMNILDIKRLIHFLLRQYQSFATCISDIPPSSTIAPGNNNNNKLSLILLPNQTPLVVYFSKSSPTL